MAKRKRISGLDGRAPADKMIRLVLRTQIKAMCALREKALDSDDPEGVHDMRVLSRRLRSAMSDFKPYLRKPNLSAVKLRAIAKSLGAVRDEDVALAALKELKSNASGDAEEGIELLAKKRRQRREERLAELKKAIRPAAITEVREEFLSKLRSITTVRPKKSRGRKTGEAILTFGRVGVETINARLKELITASRSIYHPFEIKELHELRILAKRLRYAIELFGPCWGDELKDIAKEIALLQTSLGELHDRDVWIEGLGWRLRRAARTSKDDPDSDKERQGAVWLLRHLAKERTEHYRDALARWEKWESQQFLDGLRSVLGRDDFSPHAGPSKDIDSKSSSGKAAQS